MEYLKTKFVIIFFLIVNSIVAQDTDVPSKLKDFEGIWQFVPPKPGYDSIFFCIKNKKRMDVVFYIETKKISVFEENIIGFSPANNQISKLSQLQNVGQRMFFYRPNPKAPNDSIKYYTEASPSCFASYNGLGTDIYNPPAKGKPNYFLFNFNGREYERHIQLQHLPNYVLLALLKNKKELQKVEQFLNKKYQQIKVSKTSTGSPIMRNAFVCSIDKL